MMEIDEDAQQLDLESSKSSRGSVVALMKQSLYEVLFCLFHSSQSPGKISNSMKSSYVLSRVFQSIQMVSILSIAKNSTKLWDSYGALWEILEYIRLDFIFLRIGLSGFLYLCIEGSVLLSMFLFSVLLFFAYNKKPFPDLIRKTTSLFFALYCSIFPVPILIVLLKLSFFFAMDDTGEEFTRSPINLPFALLSLFSFIFINYIYIVGASEVRHSAVSFSLESKSSCVLDLKTLQTRIAILTFYVLRGSSQVFYLGLCMCMGEGILCYNFFSTRPHYNAFSSKTKIACSMIVSLSGLAMMIAKSTNNAGVFILLAYVASPLANLCTIWLISGKIKVRPNKTSLRQMSEYPRGVHDCWELERTLRPYLLKGKKDNKELILSAFDGFFENSQRSKDTRLVVWEAYYCLNILHNERLARIKISKRMYSWFSLEGDFQAFLCLKRLNADKEVYFEDFDFLQFRLRLEENKKKDMKICENFLLLLDELTELSPKTKVVNNLLVEISENLETVNTEYDDLCIRYSMNKELLIIYQTYLSDVLYDKEKANYINQRHGRSNVFEERELNWFDEKNSLLIVSGKVSTLGAITYANEDASEMLKESPLTILGKNMEDYIPSLMNVRHNAGLRRFLLFGKDTKIRLPRSSYLVDSKGFLIEVYIKLRCLAIDSYPLFLVLFKRKSRDRDVVLIDENGRIEQYSSRIPSILSLKAKNITGHNLDEILMVYADWAFEGDISYYNLNGFRVYFHQRKIFSFQLNMYRFYPRGSAIGLHSFRKMKGSTIQTLRPTRLQQIEEMENRKIKFVSSRNQHSYEENNTIDSKLASQKSIHREQRAMLIHAKTTRCTNFLIFSLFLIFVSSIAINISNSLYVYMGFDGETYFTSLYKIWNLNTAFINISNSARNFQRTGSQVYYDSFEDHIKYFKNFRNNQKEIISIFESCDSRGKLYDSDIYYWERYEVKTINLVDFSDKLVRYSYDFFDQKETEISYAFIILNANSYPMEYLLNLSEELIECLENRESHYEFVLFMIISIGSVLKTIVIAMETVFALEIRKSSVDYWNLIVNVLSVMSTKVQSSLVSRLDMVHSVDKSKISHRNLRTDNWKTPAIPVMKYVWIPSVLFLSSIVYFCVLYFILNKNISKMVYARLDTIESIGKLNFEVQKLDYWTRESMIGDSIDDSALVLQPYKQPQMHLEQVHSDLPLLAKNLLKKNSILLLNDEFDLFYDKIKIGESIIINGIYGYIKILLMDSIYYLAITENVETEYEKFNTAIMKLTQIQEKVLHDTVDYSIDHMNEFRLYSTIINMLTVGIITMFILIAYIPFIKEERKLLRNKDYLFNVINKIHDLENN